MERVRERQREREREREKSVERGWWRRGGGLLAAKDEASKLLVAGAHVPLARSAGTEQPGTEPTMWPALH